MTVTMNYSFILLAIAFMGAHTLVALPENFRIEQDPSNPTQSIKLKWWGNPDVYYVVESNLDLMTPWNHSFYAVKGVDGAHGEGQIEAVQFAPFPETDQTFFRLLYDSNPLGLLGLTDHDGDGIATALELDAWMNATVAETSIDSEPDGLPDYWEIFYFGDLSRDGEGDFDNDGILDKFEWQARTNPAVDQAAEYIAESTGLIEYTYDLLGRLSTASGPVDMTFAFDKEGNLQSAQ